MRLEGREPEDGEDECVDHAGEEGFNVSGRMPEPDECECELRGLGVVAGVRMPWSPTSERLRSINEAGRAARCGVGFVIWVVGIWIGGVGVAGVLTIGRPVASSSSSSSSMSVCKSSALEAMDAVARLLPKLSRLPASELVPRLRLANVAVNELMWRQCQFPAKKRKDIMKHEEGACGKEEEGLPKG